MDESVKSITFTNLNDYPLNIPINATKYCISNFRTINNILNINSRNNNISFYEIDSPTLLRTGVLPPGNYSVIPFLAAIKAALEAVGTQVYTVTQFTSTRAIRIVASTKTWRMERDTVNSLFYEAGIEPLLFSGNYFNTATGNYPIDLSGVKSISIVSNNVVTSNSVVGFAKNVLGTIPVNVGFNSVVNFIPTDHQFIYCDINNLTKLELEYLDCRMRKIDLNTYSMTVLFK